jgi:hypothetical protein
MRVFIQHENGLMDANSVIDIVAMATNGGQVGLRSAIDENAQVAARIGSAASPLPGNDAKAAAKNVGADLVLAMETAAHSAKIHGTNVIDFDRGSGKWRITSLGKTATRPIES